MHMTSVTAVDLPGGSLHSCAVEVGRAGRAVPVSFDQRRHVGLGQRPGSWIALALRVPPSVSQAQLQQAWLTVIARHGTLRTVFSAPSLADGGVELALHEVDVLGAIWTEHQVPAGRRSAEVAREVFDEACAPLARPSHRLILAGVGDAHPRVLIGLDHAHADAWSLLILARDLVVCLTDLAEGRVPGLTLPAAHSFAEHSAVLESAPAAPEMVRRRWAEVLSAGGGMMPTFPLPLGDIATPQPEVVEFRDVFDADELTRFEEQAAAKGVRMLPAVISTLTRIAADVAGQPLRAVLPVHSRSQERWHDSVGWFITNAVLESADPDPQACRAALKEALALGSYPLAPIMAQYGGMPAGPGMFAMSWLDNRRLPVSIDPALRAQHVSAVIDTDGVMIWFVVSAQGLRVRCRYPDTGQARASVQHWLDLICAELADQIR
ncbi:MAG: condensation domain-containing protein [Ornithinimicrobium sp.]